MEPGTLDPSPCSNANLFMEARMDEYTAAVMSKLGVADSRLKDRNLGGLDLSRKDLTGLDLRGFMLTSTNLEGSDLTATDLRGLHFTQTNSVQASFVAADLRGADLSFGYFNNADFTAADLRGARLAEALCSECTFAGADLRGAFLATSHYDSDFRGADLRGVMCTEECDFDKLNCDIRGALVSPAKKRSAATNKRRQLRVHLSSGFTVFDRLTDEVIGTLVDLSVDGAKLSGQSPCPVGTVRQFKVELPEGKKWGTSLAFDAKSMWCNTSRGSGTYDTGFQIISIGDEDTRVMQSIIDDHRSRKIEIL